MITLSNELLELQQKVREFIQQEVIPLESDPRQDSHGPSEALRQELVSRACSWGLLTPHASREMGGLGWSHLQKAVAFEEAGYSALGPIALNIHAPDEGNIHLLDVVANDAQKERWLKKLVAGEIRSCFTMTEPAPGAGSDPSMLQTTAIADGDDYIINGRKWLITGADGASVAIIMAKMEDGSASMFLTDTNVEGFILEKNMNAMDSCFSGGHGILRFENLRIPNTCGVIPLVIASGASSETQHALGTGVFGGMISATILAIFFVPVFFIFILGAVEKLFSSKKKISS